MKAPASGALALSLDIGTSSTRALLWDTAGREVEGAAAHVQYQMTTTPDGGVEMPAEDLFNSVARCVDDALRLAGDRASQIRAVGISTFWHSLLGLDSRGRPLTPIFSWADTRAGDAAVKLRHTWRESAVHRRTGCMIHPSYYPAKLTWLRDTRPDLFRRVARWASPSEFLAGRLFGAAERRVSVSMASGTGLFDQRRCRWDPVTLAALDLPLAGLAPIVDLTEPAVGLADPFAARWPSLRGVPFFPAVGDGACGNIGSGCVNPETMAINLGTSGAIRVVWHEDPPSPGSGKSVRRGTTDSERAAARAGAAMPPRGLWRYRVDRRRPIVGAAFSDGGNVFAWMSSTLQLPPTAELEKALAARRHSSSELTFLPFLAGERSMGWNPDAAASLVGMNLNTSPTDILCAGLEAVALRFALAAEMLRGLFPSARRIVASGGALPHSPAWAQMIADAIGEPVTLAAEPEASSRGAALLAMEAAGMIESVEAIPAQLGPTYTPDPAARTRSAEMLARQQELYRKLV